MNSELPLDRRGFLAATSAIAFSQLVARAVEPKTFLDLSKQIHPNAQIYREEVPKDENSYWIWKNAIADLTPLHEFSTKFYESRVPTRLAYADEIAFAEAVDTIENLATPFPAGAARQCVIDWLDSNSERVALIRKGLRQRRYQVPKEDLISILDDEIPLDLVSMPRSIARLLQACYRYQMETSDFVAAENTVSELIHLADITLGGDGYLLHYLLACVSQTIATNVACSYATDTRSPIESLERLRKLLVDTRPRVSSLVRVFQIEVVYFTQHEVARLPTDLSKLVDAIIHRHLMLGQSDPSEAFTDDAEVRRVRQGMVRLFKGHPKPFNHAETVSLYSEIVTSMIGDLSSSWLQRKRDYVSTYRKEVELWPEQLRFLNRLFHGVGDESELTNTAIEAAKAALAKVRNPIGKLMLLDLEVFENVRRAFHIGQLRTDIALLVIAVRLFRDRNGRLPHALSDLVDSSLIDSVPVDPFSGESVRYDAKRKVVWSFGINEEDNGGDWDFAADVANGDDLVWRVA